MRGVGMIGAVVAGVLLAGEAAGGEWMLELSLRGRRLQGTPLAWSEKSVELLARDGAWWTFRLDEAQDYRKLEDGFRPFTPGELRAMLLGEFPAYEVSGTGNYLVVHPAGRRSQWAERFEELYRTFVQYFAVRGFRLRPPRFPLVAVVFPTKSAFFAHAARQGVSLPEGVLGYYSRATNRILLYDLTAEAGDGFVWSDNAATIIHEAVHQTAFNMGVHNRFAAPPVWAVEGLATLFEAPGVYDARRHASLESRVNRERLTSFRRSAAPRQTAPVLAELIASDRLFQRRPDAAYAYAWALTFFLSEQYPQQYARYLTKTAARPAFSDYGAPERLDDFTAEFGADFAMLESRLLRFLATVK